MKIIQINSVCGTGSTGKIVVDICKLGKQHDFNMSVGYGRGSSPSEINTYKIGNAFDFINHVLVNFTLGQNGFASQHVTRKFLNWLDTQKPDIIHLHNLHGFYINVELLFQYIKSKNIPTVWTFHDCWPITGQCAHFDSIQCSKWTEQCYECPIYRTKYPYSIFHDNSRKNYIRKRECFTNVPNLTIVTPSNWLANIVKHSYLKEYPCKVIPNGINLNLFTPQKCSIDTSARKIILGVANVWTKYKGLHDFYKLADFLPDNFQIVLIGVNKQQKKYIERNYSDRFIAITHTNNQQELAAWYNKAFVFVNPTYEDTFPTTHLESLACGTPVITYNTGGCSESLDSKCGIVVEKGNISELANAILSLPHDSSLSASCRSRAQNYDRFTCFQAYIELYKNMHISQ